MDETAFRMMELEYKEASLLMQRGISNFFRVMNTFIFATILMMSLSYLCLRLPNAQDIRLFVVCIALLGILFSVTILILFKKAEGYVGRGLTRASELEAQFGGKVFTRILDAEKQSRHDVIQLNFIIVLLCYLFVLGWMLMVYAALAG